MHYQQYFPSVDDNFGQEIISQAKEVSLPPETTIFHQGDSCNNFILVMEGTVKVFTRASNGREIVLYRVSKGQSCTLTTSCLLASDNYPAEAVTESQVQALVLSLDHFNQGLAQSPSFRQFVFNTYGQRLCDVISLVSEVSEVSGNRIDNRLAKQLLSLSHNNSVIHKTHQELATDLGTAREVITRQLNQFAEQQWLKLSRGKIELLQPEPLKSLANVC